MISNNGVGIMALVPSGKTRLMVAQQFANPMSEGYGGVSIADEQRKSSIDPMSSTEPGANMETDNNMETNDAMEEDIGGGPVNDDVSIGTEEQQNLAPHDKGRKTLTTFIYETLESYGYPGRRLQEFKSEFVKESVSPEGIKDIEVVIPDKKYPDEKGFTDTVENEELRQIAHGVNQAFGLNFNGAERAGGKWTIKFTSVDLPNPEEEAVTRDSLDQVYGRPDKAGRPGEQSGQKPVVQTQRAAFTIREMIKDQKDKIVNKLKKIVNSGE